MFGNVKKEVCTLLALFYFCIKFAVIVEYLYINHKKKG